MHVIPNIRSTILATLGPSTSTSEVIESLILEGVHMFRLNFSHGTPESLGAVATLIREVSDRLKQPVGILGDLSGPKIRIGSFAEEGVDLLANDTFTITENLQDPGTRLGVGSNYPYLTKDIQPGDHVLLDDGRVILEALEKLQRAVRFRVVYGGRLTNSKGMNLPGIPLSVESITEKDRADFKWMLEFNLDFVALSFVRDARCIHELRTLAGGHPIKIITKIEKPEAVLEIDAIIDASDGIMVARGDLGVEMPLEKVPAIQKDLIRRCIASEVPVITATQMLDSMALHSRPTRAEASDVFNAVLDGSDSIMLSNETAIGLYPLEAVRTMTRIAAEAESLLAKDYSPEKIMAIKKTVVRDGIPEDPVKARIQKKGRAMAHVACQSAIDLGAKAIVTWTKNGNTARRIANYHPPLPVIALCPSARVCQQLTLHYGVIPIKAPMIDQIEKMFQMSGDIAMELGVASPGDVIVIVAGIPFTDQGHTNLLKLHVVPGDPAL